MRLIALLFLLFVLFFTPAAFATTYTSVKSGDWNDPSVWNAGDFPGDQDTVIISSGHTITVRLGDYAQYGKGGGLNHCVVGSNSGTAHGIRIMGLSPSSYGRLEITPGVTLTMKGVNRLYYAMKIERYGVFAPMPGSTVQVDCLTDGQTGILNEGAIDARGNAQDPVRFSVPSENIDWNKPYSATVPSATLYWPYDEDRYIACIYLPKTRISNSTERHAGVSTGIGSYDDSSLKISNRFAGGRVSNICTTPVSSLDEVSTAGKYYVDHATGTVYFYHKYADGNPSFSVSFNYLNDDTSAWRGWFIDMAAGTANDVTYNEGLFDYCIFEYMGSMGGTRLPAIRVGYKRSHTVEAHRLFFLKHSTLQWCGTTLWFRQSCIGSLSDPILVDSNTFLQCAFSGHDTGAESINISAGKAGDNHSYITFSSNIIHQRNFIDGAVYGTELVHKGIQIVNNTQVGATSFYRDFTPPGTTLADGLISGNVIDGVNMATVWTRLLLDIKGSDGHPCIIESNTFSHALNGIVVDANAIISGNTFNHSYNAGIRSGLGFSPHSRNVSIINNLFRGVGTRGSNPVYATYGDLGAIALYSSSPGYQTWIDKWIIANNTIVNVRRGGLSMGNLVGDSGPYTTILTGVQYFNNLIHHASGGEIAVQRRADTSQAIVRGALASFDNNLFSNYTTVFGPGINRSATFLKKGGNYNLLSSNHRNVTGVELWNPTYSQNQPERNLELTVAGTDNVTLKWGSGTAKQLVWQSTASISAPGQNVNLSYGQTTATRITDSSRSWSTDAGSPNCPRGRWLKLIGGSGSGPEERKVFAIVNNTANTIDVIPPMKILPNAGDSYVIYNVELVLGDGGTPENSVSAGIRLEDLPSASSMDTGISIELGRTVTGDPKLLNATGSTTQAYQISPNSPAKNAGTDENAPFADFWGTARKQGPRFDIGIHEVPAPAIPGKLTDVTPAD